MVKLSRNEIETAFEQENVLIDLPRDAHSVFRFEIEETSADLWEGAKKTKSKDFRDKSFINHKGENVQYGDIRKPWKFSSKNEREGLLIDTLDPYWKANIQKTDDGLKITTATSHYVYTIKDRKDGNGSEVLYDGPFNSLMKHALLPQMTYKHHTLEGKFIDAVTKEDITEFMDINTYGAMRERKNQLNSNEDDKNYDSEGFKSNEFFNNEIKFLPEYLLAQDFKNMKAQRDFDNAKKVRIGKYTKEAIHERLKAAKGKVSGVVKADKQAEEIISAKVRQKLQGGRD